MEEIINNDSTLYSLYNANIDYNLLEHQVAIKIAVSKIAFSKYFNLKYAHLIRNNHNN